MYHLLNAIKSSHLWHYFLKQQSLLLSVILFITENKTMIPLVLTVIFAFQKCKQLQRAEVKDPHVYIEMILKNLYKSYHSLFDFSFIQKSLFFSPFLYSYASYLIFITNAASD